MKKIVWAFVVFLAASCQHIAHHEHEHNHDCDHDHACESEHAHEFEHDEVIENAENANAVHFSEEQMKQCDFAVEEVKLQPIGEVIKTVAYIEPARGNEVVVVAKTNGIVTFAANAVFEGQKVSNSQPLCTVSGSEMADNNLSVRISEAKNNYESAKSNYERSQKLVTEKIVSEKELLAQKNEYENAKIVYEQLTKNFSSEGQQVTSPMNGFVKQIFIENGSYVEMGQPLMVVASDQFLMLIAEVRSSQAALVNRISTATLFDPSHQKSFTLEELNGAIVSRGRAATSANHSLPITLKIKNLGNFVVGTFVDIYLQTDAKTKTLAVANSALLEEQGVYFVFVQIAPELFEKQIVEVGNSNGKRTEILKGLHEGQKVVSQGAVLVKLAQAAAKLDPHAGHAH